MIDPRAQQSELFAKARQRLIEGVARELGGRASDAVKLPPDEELELYRRPTSQAAQEILARGGTLEDAEAANAQWYAGKKAAQQALSQQMQQQGAAPEQIAKQLAQEGLTDAAIYRECRLHADDLAKQNGKNDPAEEIRYHEKMSQKVAAARMAGQGGMTYANADC